MRKDMRDRKNMRGTKYIKYTVMAIFYILLLIKSILGTFPLLTICLQILINIKPKDKTICSIYI